MNRDVLQCVVSRFSNEVGVRISGVFSKTLDQMLKCSSV